MCFETLDGHLLDFESVNIGPLPATVADGGRELSVARDIRVLVEDVLGRDADVLKEELAVVDTVATKLDTHVLDTDALGGGHILLADADQNRMDTLVLASDKGLGENNAPLGVNSRLLKKEIQDVNERTNGKRKKVLGIGMKE